MLTVSAHYLAAIVGKCEALGIARETLLRGLPMGEDTFENPMRRLPDSCLADVYAVAKSETGFTDIGLRVGEQLSVSSMNEAGKLLPVCATIGDAARMTARYHRLTQTFGYTRLDISGDPVLVTWHSHYDDPGPYADILIGVFAGFVSAGRWMSYDGLQWPLKLEFRARSDMDTAWFCDKYNCEITLGAAQDRLISPPEFMAHKLASSDPRMFDAMSERIDILLAKIDDDNGLEQRVAASIRIQMREGAPSLEATAGDINVPVRRIRAGLSAAGTSFRKVVDMCRQDACARYLARGMPKSQIAYRLGFHDQPALNRAYRRWYGTAPP